MYFLNTLQTNVLITPAEVLFHAETDHAVDERKILQSIIVAEERFIRQELGFDMYEALIEQKNKLVTSSNKNELTIQVNTPERFDDMGNPNPIVLQVDQVINSRAFLSTENRKLWDKFLWKLTAECVIGAALPGTFVQFQSTGAVHAQPTTNALGAAGAVTPGLNSMKWALDKKIQDRIDPLINSLHQFICKARGILPTAYALYEKDCDCDAKGNKLKTVKKTQFVTGLYDNAPKNCCNGWDQFEPYSNPSS